MVDEEKPDTDKIITLANREWLTREELADHLDVSPRTLSSMIHRGDVERRETPEDTLYRFLGHSPKSEEDKASSQDVQKIDAPAAEPSPTQVVSVGFEQWTSAREDLARREVKLGAALEDTRRAVQYAEQLEEECDRLADEANQVRQRTAQLRSEIDEERGRRQELDEQYSFVLSELEEMGGLRARYHLERGRREQADESVEKLTDQLHRLRRYTEKLTEALQEAEERGFKAEIGPLTVEIKR